MSGQSPETALDEATERAFETMHRECIQAGLHPKGTWRLVMHRDLRVLKPSLLWSRPTRMEVTAEHQALAASLGAAARDDPLEYIATYAGKAFDRLVEHIECHPAARERLQLALRLSSPENSANDLKRRYSEAVGGSSWGFRAVRAPRGIQGRRRVRVRP